MEIISETYKFVAGDEVGKLADYLPFCFRSGFVEFKYRFRFLKTKI